MKINYAKLITNYLTLKTNIKKSTKALKLLYDEKEKTKKNINSFEKLISKNLEFKINSLNTKLTFLENQITKLEMSLKEDKIKFDILKTNLSNFKVSVGTVLKAILPDFDTNKYLLSANSSFIMQSEKPIDRISGISYYYNNPTEVEAVYFTISAKNKKTKKETCFYKFYNVKEKTQDGTILANILDVDCERDFVNKKYYAKLTLPLDKICSLYLDITDFHYSKMLQNNIYNICKAKQEYDKINHIKE